MKQIKLVCLAAIAVMMMMTSCLGDSDNEQTFYLLPGVARLDGTRLLVDTRLGTVYSSSWKWTDYEANQCLLVSFNLNMDDPANADVETKGYYTVTPAGYDVIEIEDGYVNVSAYSDTTKVIRGEFALEDAVYNAGNVYLNDVISSNLIISSLFSCDTEQVNRWYMIFDQNQEPAKYNGKNLYTAYIRVSKEKDGTTPALTGVYDMHKYDTRSQLLTINNKEKENGTYYLQFRYVSNITEVEATGETKLTWKSSDSIFSFYTVTEE